MPTQAGWGGGVDREKGGVYINGGQWAFTIPRSASASSPAAFNQASLQPWRSTEPGRSTATTTMTSSWSKWVSAWEPVCVDHTEWVMLYLSSIFFLLCLALWSSLWEQCVQLCRVFPYGLTLLYEYYTVHWVRCWYVWGVYGATHNNSSS